MIPLPLAGWMNENEREIEKKETKNTQGINHFGMFECSLLIQLSLWNSFVHFYEQELMLLL